MAVSTSTKEKGGGRLVSTTLLCVHGMPLRKKTASSGNNTKSRKSDSQRTGCGCKINIRWPIKTDVYKHPRLTTMELEHLHAVDKEAADVQQAQKGPLTTPMKATSAKLTDAGLKPAAQAVVIEALHDRRVHPRTMQNEVIRHREDAHPFDAQDLLQKVQACTKDGGVYKVKLDENGRLSHLFWMTAEQIALASRYGSVLLYDDTAVKNRYRLPLGLGVVIDGEYFSRIVFQSLTVDTTAVTFEWVLEEFKAARGAAPDMFLQDADAAMGLAADKVFPDARKRRCMWHLGQNLMKNLKKVLGSAFQAFLDQFYKTRGRLTESGFEEEYAKLVETFPKAKEYMAYLYKDRERWAVYSSVLVFSAASYTTNRVESMNAQAKRVLNSQASLVRVFKFLSDAIEKQAARAELRSAQLRLPSVSTPDTATYWFGAALTTPCKFALGVWAYKFMMDEVAMCATFCSSPSNALLEGASRDDALGKFEYIGMMVVNVETVAVIVENHDGTDKRYIVLGMTDGSHLCSCRTLQELGLCCRHFWAAMRLSRRYKFHVGILNQHWLAEQGRKPTSEWPEGAKPTWAVALNHKALSEGEKQAPLVATGRLQCATEGDEGGGGAGAGVQWDAGNVTIESSLVQLKETGPTPQDRRFLYVDCLKEATAAVSLGVETVPPEALRALVRQFKQGVHQASRIGSSAGLAVANPAVVRLPTSRDTGKRKRASHEGGAVVGAARRAYNQSYS
ncbi:unnamed protein product [Ectocarpus sp. CCAP 1310/34]|nr:unnamed protein product [Ectocarpus sp. CCAP 1310/34]